MLKGMTNINAAQVIGGKSQGVQELWLGPNLFVGTGYTAPATTGQLTGAADGTAGNYRRLLFQKDAANIVRTGLFIELPKSWNVASTLSLRFITSKSVTGTGTKVQMLAKLMAVAPGDLLTQTFTSAATAIPIVIGANNAVMSNIAVVPVDLTPAKGDLLFMEIARDSTTANSANDDYDNTYSFLGVILSYVDNAADDS